jgi:hypothetical protein
MLLHSAARAESNWKLTQSAASQGDLLAERTDVRHSNAGRDALAGRERSAAGRARCGRTEGGSAP